VDAPGTQHLVGDVAGRLSVRDAARWSLIGAAAYAGLAAALFVLVAADKMPDFEVYWRAAVRAAAAEPLYRPEDGHYQFKYLPGFAIMAMPLGYLDFLPAAACWYAVSAALLLVLFRISRDLLPEQRKPTAALVTFAVIAMGRFYARELGLGQVNLLFAVVAAGALLAMKSRRERLAGALVAASLVLKPYGVILLPWLLVRRRMPAIASASLGLVAAFLLPLPVYGVTGTIELHRAWWQTVVSTTAPNLLTPENVSWLAMHSRWFGPGSLAEALTLATLGAAAMGGVFVWRARRGVAFPEGLEGGLLLLLIPFVSPQGWDYVLLIATPAMFYLANYADALPRPLQQLVLVACAAVGLAIYDVMGRAGYLWFLNMSGVAICFAVIAAALVLLRLRRVA
jgi:hypothetical protein